MFRTAATALGHFCLFAGKLSVHGIRPFAGSSSVCGEFVRLWKFVRKAENCPESGNLSGKWKFVRKVEICPESINLSGRRKSRIPELYKAEKPHPGGDSSARERKETGDAEK